MSKPLKIVADENMPFVREIFSSISPDITTIPGRTMSPDDVADADILLVRSVTPINQSLLDQSSVKFVGSATIGTDHVDHNWLGQQGIKFANSPGCNAESVVDYVIAALYHYQQQTQKCWRESIVGIVGCGQVGGRLTDRLQQASVQVLRNDPPRQDAGEQGLVSLDYLLTNADIICLHTPLTHQGKHPSYHLIGTRELDLIGSDALLLNAGRGPVISDNALIRAMENGSVPKLILDVWETEPTPDVSIIKQSMLATPHIAGYSLDGRVRGTSMLFEAVSRWLGNYPDLSRLPTYGTAPSAYVWQPGGADYNIDCAIKSIWNISEDDALMRQALSEKQPAQRRAVVFDSLRKSYRIRREFSCLDIKCVPENWRSLVRSLGFNVIE